jgi:hypothetical protein
MMGQELDSLADLVRSAYHCHPLTPGYPC